MSWAGSPQNDDPHVLILEPVGVTLFERVFVDMTKLRWFWNIWVGYNSSNRFLIRERQREICDTDVEER